MPAPLPPPKPEAAIRATAAAAQGMLPILVGRKLRIAAREEDLRFAQEERGRTRQEVATRGQKQTAAAGRAIEFTAVGTVSQPAQAHVGENLEVQ